MSIGRSPTSLPSEGQNVAMRRVHALLRDQRSGPLLRYAVAGATVAAVYLATPLVLTALVGIPLEVAIPIAYVAAVCLHFNLQRHFVFRHVRSFALSTRYQVARYVVIGAVQYPTAAVSTAVLPGLLGVSARVIYVCTAVTISAVFFLILRTHVFHAAPETEAERSANLVDGRAPELVHGAGDRP
jgi:putative flippase GtrA